MLFLFGRFSGPARIVIGAALLGIGLGIHQVGLAVVGGVFVVWGGARMLRSWRNRGEGTHGDRGETK